MRSRSPHFDDVRGFLERVPLVDCHDHSGACGPKYSDPIAAIVTGYFRSDMVSASSERDVNVMTDSNTPLAERWPVFLRGEFDHRGPGSTRIEDEAEWSRQKREGQLTVEFADTRGADGLYRKYAACRVGDRLSDERAAELGHAFAEIDKLLDAKDLLETLQIKRFGELDVDALRATEREFDDDRTALP